VAGASNISSFTDLLDLIGFGPPISASNDIEPTGFAAKIGPVSGGAEPTAIALASSPNPSSQGQSVTFTATVTPPDSSGVVNFYVDRASAGSANLNAGSAMLTHASLSGGNHSITAEYFGDANFAASTSAALTQVVNNISLTAAQSSVTVANGGRATFPLTVGQVGALTSAITFSCSGLPTGWSCGFNPTTVPAGSGATQVTLTVQTGSTTGLSLPRAPTGSRRFPGLIWLGVLVLLMLAVIAGGQARKAAYLRPGFALGFSALLLLASGCGSGSSHPPQPFTVSLAVNATSDTTAASMPFTITVK
jgi:hypothetical protein